VNLTRKIKQKILLEFKRGMSMERIADVYLQPLRAIERIIREALCRQDEADQKELELTVEKKADAPDA